METETARDQETIYAAYRPLLVSIAYRMLGLLSDAEDIVQDVFVSMQRVRLDDVRHTKAYLVKMTTNLCLNKLASARRQRKAYTGPWLPEPDVETASTPGPEERVIREDEVSYALLVLLQQLSPVERAVFLLREVLDYDYKDVADILGKSEANCRKIYSRVKPKVLHAAPSPTAATVSLDEVVQMFLLGSRTGNFGPFVQWLSEQAALISDGGGKRRAALLPILGKKRIRAFLEGIWRRGTLRDGIRPVSVNGEPGLLKVRDGLPYMAVCFGTEPHRPEIRTVYFIVNPDKLKRILAEEPENA